MKRLPRAFPLPPEKMLGHSSSLHVVMGAHSPFAVPNLSIQLIRLIRYRGRGCGVGRLYGRLALPKFTRYRLLDARCAHKTLRLAHH